MSNFADAVHDHYCRENYYYNIQQAIISLEDRYTRTRLSAATFAEKAQAQRDMFELTRGLRLLENHLSKHYWS